ncbi:MAG: hypothetical protein ACE5KK_06240 [Candidatus Brocadiales bacterium]
MEISRSNGFLLIITGAVLGIVSTHADAIGLGSPATGFSWEQGLGTFIGALAIIFGIYLIKLDARLLVLIGLVVTAFAVLADKIGMGAPGYGCPQGIVTFLGLAIFFMGANSLKAKA